MRTGGANCLRREHSVIEGAQTHPHNKNHWQRQRYGEVSHRLSSRNRHAPPTHTLYHNVAGLPGEPCIALPDAGNVDLDAHGIRGQMGGGRDSERIGVDVFVSCMD